MKNRVCRGKVWRFSRGRNQRSSFFHYFAVVKSILYSSCDLSAASLPQVMSPAAIPPATGPRTRPNAGLAACCSSPSLILPTSACPKSSLSGRQQLLFTPAPETKSGVSTTCGEPTKASKTDLPEERVRKPLHGVLYGKHGARHQASSDLPAPAARARFPAPVRAPAA